MTTHSPGPWTAPDNKSFYVTGRHGGLLASCNSRINAVLVSASPDMLSALRLAKAWMACDEDLYAEMTPHDQDVYNTTMMAVNAAINKATRQ